MEYGLRADRCSSTEDHDPVLILVLMEYGLRVDESKKEMSTEEMVLILVLMEYGLREISMTEYVQS